MLMHHIATLALTFGSSYANLMGIGTVIIYLHAIADILLPLVLFFNSTIYQDSLIVPVCFALEAVVWAYTRLGCFFILVSNTILNDATSFIDELVHYNIFLRLNSLYLCCLQILHVYWFYHILKILLAGIMSGKVEDTHFKLKEGKEKHD